MSTYLCNLLYYNLEWQLSPPPPSWPHTARVFTHHTLLSSSFSPFLAFTPTLSHSPPLPHPSADRQPPPTSSSSSPIVRCHGSSCVACLPHLCERRTADLGSETQARPWLMSLQGKKQVNVPYIPWPLFTSVCLCPYLSIYRISMEAWFLSQNLIW